jgi:hypothetical protein
LIAPASANKSGILEAQARFRNWMLGLTFAVLVPHRVRFARDFQAPVWVYLR